MREVEIEAILVQRIKALQQQTDRDERDKIMRKAQLALLAELLEEVKS